MRKAGKHIILPLHPAPLKGRAVPTGGSAAHQRNNSRRKSWIRARTRQVNPAFCCFPAWSSRRDIFAKRLSTLLPYPHFGQTLLFPDWAPSWETIHQTSLPKNIRSFSHRGAAGAPFRYGYLHQGLLLSPDVLCALP